MENPATWGEAEWVVCAAIEGWEVAHANGMIGLSKVRYITDALRFAGLLEADRPKEKPEGLERPWTDMDGRQ